MPTEKRRSFSPPPPADSKFSTLFYPTDTPGSSSANLRVMPFVHLPRPFYPLDDIDTFDDSVTFY